MCKKLIFITNTRTKPSKEKVKHVLQTQPTKLFLSNSNEDDKSLCKMNFLEVCFLYAIIYHLRNLYGDEFTWNGERVHEVYALVLSSLRNLGIILPLNRWSITTIRKELNKLKKTFDSE